ncbi:MAG: N-acetylneuraminate synthase family protein, partial [Nanoarchaeota archaeon]|nr:N-acetylneuraminate synthase family protein [Nanoarchaeota archaeon]
LSFYKNYLKYINEEFIFIFMDIKNIIETKKTFLIAEVAGAHDGIEENMISLIKSAGKAKADAIKFQIFNAEQLVIPEHPKYEGFKAKEFSLEKWIEFSKLCSKNGLKVMLDVFDLKSLEYSKKMENVIGYKIHSTIISDPYLVREIAKTGKTIIIGTGGSNSRELREAIEICREEGNEDLVLMAGFQSFPTKLSDSNLNQITALADKFKLPVGYSDHCDAETKMAMIMPLLAVSKGAVIVEKHFTNDRSLKKTDYFSSLNPDELKQLFVDIRELDDVIMGKVDIDTFSDDELNYRKTMKKYIVSSRDIKKGEKLSLDCFEFKRTNEPGLMVSDAQYLIGKEVLEDIKQNELISKTKLKYKVLIGIIVRMKSARLPKKALAMLGNQSIIEHLIDRMKTCKMADEVMLCTSTNPQDACLLDVAKKKGIPSMTGDELDVLKRLIDAGEMVNADIVLRVTGDNPLTSPKFIDDAIKRHLETGNDYTFTRHQPQGTKGEIFSIEALRKAYKMAEDSSFSEYLTWYFTDNPDIFRMENMQVPENVRRPEYRFTVDTPEDLEMMREIYKNLYKEGEIISLADAVKFVDENPDVLKINGMIKDRNVRSEVNVALKKS